VACSTGSGSVCVSTEHVVGGFLAIAYCILTDVGIVANPFAPITSARPRALFSSLRDLVASVLSGWLTDFIALAYDILSIATIFHAFLTLRNAGHSGEAAE
jgi:hypothetical protein